MKNLILILSIGALAACQQAAKPKQEVSPRVSPEQWSQSMWQLSAVLSSVLPTISQAGPIPKEKKAELISQTKQLESIAHNVDQLKIASIQDPSLPMVSKEFKKELQIAVKQMEADRWTSGTRHLQRATRYCIACHTMKEGKSFDLGAGLSPKLEGLSTIQKADFYASTRQFDAAIMNYETGLTDTKWANANPKDWNAAAQRLLAISVRVNDDPSLTMELISRFFDSDTYPKDLKEDAHLWRTHAKTWRQEGKHNLTPTQQITLATKLVSTAETMKGEQGFILYLRASALLHRALGNKLAQEQQLKSLYYSGLAAEGLKTANFWIYPEDFYESCRSINSKSTWSNKCKDRLTKLKE